MNVEGIPENLPGWIADHLRRYLETDGADGHYYDASARGGGKAIASLLLKTEGRRSGKPLLLPLFYCDTPGGGYAVIASKGGAPQHPAWYLNLTANPEVGVQVGARKFRARARTAAGGERQALWDRMLAIWPPYADYQKKTDREIPVVVLEPLNAAA
jgi:proline iminopeptidase